VQPNYAASCLQYPGGFRRRGFSQESRRNFLRLQEANDRGDLARLRQVTTEDMFNTLKDDVAGHSGAQQTDVVTLNASLLKLVTEASCIGERAIFPVSIREEASALAERSRRSAPAKAGERRLGWLLAGCSSPVDRFAGPRGPKTP